MLKLSAAHLAHLASYVVSRVEAGEFKSVRMVDGVVKLTDRDGDVEYHYRSFRIEQNDAVAKGYYGRWNVGSVRGWGDSTLEGCKAYIDGKFCDYPKRQS